jgi:hypothetical protein
MRFFVLLASFSAVLTVRADEPPIIAKARAYLGSEDALNSVNSVYLDGKFSAVDSPENPTNQHSAAVQIILQKPYLHRLVVTAEADKGNPDSPSAKIIALDGYDGWQREPNPSDPANPLISLLGAAQKWALRADVWENLFFYRGAESEGITTQDLGPVQQDGHACEEIAFIHSPTITYYRYFDQNTGQLIFTQTKEGLQIREQGEISVDGIRFPKTIITAQKLPSGGQRVVTLDVDHITVNDVFSDSLFDLPMPMLPPSDSKPAAPAPMQSSLPSEPTSATPLPSGLAP